LAEHLISEAAELLEAIDNEDFGHIREELGDVLCQVAMHAQIARESGHFDFNDVASEINDKLVRRHPHVFGDEQGQLPDSSAVLQRWEQIKAEEKRHKGIASTAQRLFKDLPPRLPATLFARDVAKQIVKKEMNLPNGVREVVGRDESSLPASRVQGQNGERADCPESDAHQSGEGGETVEESLGRELFALCARAYHHKVDPESALRRYAQQVVAEVEARNG
jgi:XTP/dITP diphosphohydrolase/tetrapyrrole methylase family protein/MazG family protein